VLEVGNHLMMPTEMRTQFITQKRIRSLDLGLQSGKRQE